MDILIETDIGRDPDDFFTLCYLISAGVDIRGITITPGDKDQVAVTRLITSVAGLDIPIGVSDLNRNKRSSGGVHYSLLDKYGMPKESESDGLGKDIIKSVIDEFPDCELLSIGPVSNVMAFLNESDHVFKKATMQGGFLPYYLSRPIKTLEKFEGKSHFQSFNLNGDVVAGLEYASTDQILERRFVGKNICHTVLYDKNIHKTVVPKDEVSNLFYSGMSIYLSGHDSKKYHDPAAAVCLLHPEIGKWFRGNLVQDISKGWTTISNENGDFVLADIDYEALWDYIANFK